MTGARCWDAERKLRGGLQLERRPELTGRDPARIDPGRGRVFDVPIRFTTADLQAAARACDPVPGDAAAEATPAMTDC
jgi:hypothetical protein